MRWYGGYRSKCHRNKRRYGPKKPKSAFLFYSSERRAALREEQPDLPMLDVSRVLGEEWNHLTEQEKAPYLQMATKDRNRYDEERQRNT